MGRWIGPLMPSIKVLLLNPFTRQRLRTFVSGENREDLLVLNELIEDGKLTPIIDTTYPLGDAVEAMRYLEERHARGKVVITV